MIVYGFQCPKCLIVSGWVSLDASDAPTCCDGERMVPIARIFKDEGRVQGTPTPSEEQGEGEQP